MPSVPFVLLLEAENCASLFFAPADMHELSECAEAFAHGKLLKSRAVLALNAEKNVLKFLELSRLSKNTRFVLFGHYSGLSVKEIASLMGCSNVQVSVIMNCLKELSGIFDKRALLVNTMEWIKLGAMQDIQGGRESFYHTA